MALLSVRNMLFVCMCIYQKKEYTSTQTFVGITDHDNLSFNVEKHSIPLLVNQNLSRSPVTQLCNQGTTIKMPEVLKKSIITDEPSTCVSCLARSYPHKRVAMGIQRSASSGVPAAAISSASVSTVVALSALASRSG